MKKLLKILVVSLRQINQMKKLLKFLIKNFEAKKAIKNTTSITKRSSHRAKVKQLNNNNIEAIATIGQKHKAKEFNKDSSLAIR
ncbi:unnamed protein product [Rhizophagus irregularis]|nr:unnamed protein product [Rhizophagus irregularis]